MTPPQEGVAMDGEALLAALPQVRGKLQPMVPLAPYTWLRVGGPAEVLFSPADAQDLAAFLRETPGHIPVTAVGVGSNLIVRDGGVPGVVVRLGRGFNQIETDGRVIRAGAAALDARVALAAADAGIAGLEFLRGVPGAIGGALRMNAGAYGRYMADIFVEAQGVTRAGEIVLFTPDQMSFSYRDSAPRDVIFTAAVLKGAPDASDLIHARMQELMAKREAAQPVKDRTAGSTFRNPAGFSSTGAEGESQELKAWKVIEEAGCRGLRLGGAVMNEKHTNFLTNAGGASAADLENLGEEVRRRVMAHSGVDLLWEIERIGRRED